MAKIKNISARQIINAAGYPTIEASVTLSDDITCTASCPSGTSVGSYEAFTLLDQDPTKNNGLGVEKAIQNIETIISPKLVGMDATKQQEIDRAMIDLDGTQNKGRIGANAMLPVSIAVAKASAQSSVLPLYIYLRTFIPSSAGNPIKIPTPLFTLISDDPGQKSGLDFEDYIIIPATSKSFSESLDIGTKSYKGMQDHLKSNHIPSTFGYTGGFSPPLSSNDEALSLIQKVAESVGLNLSLDAFLGIDCSATKFYRNQQYILKDNGQAFSTKSYIQYYQELVKKYHLIYLEDPLSEDDWDGWSEIVKALSQDASVIGDDLTATNLYRLQMAIDKKAITGIAIKPNQIGTVIESLAVIEVARAAGLKTVISQRAQETGDDFIADFSVAVGADYVKFGPPVHGEHVAKYNRLLQIESQLKKLQNV